MFFIGQNALKANELQTLSSGWQEYLEIDGIEEKDLYLFHYNREELEKRGNEKGDGNETGDGNEKGDGNKKGDGNEKMLTLMAQSILTHSLVH